MAVALRVVLVLAIFGFGCERTPAPEQSRLERIVLGPSDARRPVGDAQHFTATGHYAGGVTKNLTQRVRYASSDPAIARAENADGDRSRVEALAPGTVTITATDPKSGVTSSSATLTVLGALERIELTPRGVKRRIGESQRLTATGHYAGGATRNLTQKVEYRSSDPAVAAVSNGAGDKSRVETISAGTATISAVDPASGVASTASGGDAIITVAPAS